MVARSYEVVDVFGGPLTTGNPVAVVVDADGLDDAAMAAMARWTNLSETTFLLPPSTPAADYRVRIFTPAEELPFAGHPTLGSAHAWLGSGGRPRVAGRIVQECAAGLIALRHDAGDARTLTFAAPPRIRTGQPDDAELAGVLNELGLERSHVVAAEWVDNGPGWIAVLVDTPERVLGVAPGPLTRKVGVVALRAGGADGDLEVRAFFPIRGHAAEDPVTGSLNASLAQWLIESGRLRAPYEARQGRALGRDGRVRVSVDDDGAVWIGGSTLTGVRGTLDL